VTAAGGDDDTAAVAQQLVRRAGGYLRNPIRESGATCGVCTTPVDGFDRCFVCQSAYDATPGLADLVIPLTYGIAGAQSGFLLRAYKDNPDARVRQQQGRVINWLLYLAILVHEGCIGRGVGVEVSRRLAVPSIRGRVGVHPFDVIARQMNATRESSRLAVSQVDMGERIVSVDSFALDPETDLAGQHVLILDDTWTTGASAQSAVLAARRAGAAAVSVLVVGRWLRPEFGHNAQFIKKRLARDYDPWICPVTGAECP
jgi:hypothetical protein